MEMGWFKVHRCLMDKPIWTLSTPEQKVILITLLSMANHEANEWEWKGQKYVVKPGQIITSLIAIANKAGEGVTKQNVRTALTRFEKLNFLTNESTMTGRLITIVNWGLYQGVSREPNIAPNIDLTQSQHSANTVPNIELTPNKNDKKNKNDKNDIYISLSNSPLSIADRLSDEDWERLGERLENSDILSLIDEAEEKGIVITNPYNYLMSVAYNRGLIK